MAHLVEIQTQAQQDDAGNPTGMFRYRWRCSCGAPPGPWCEGSDDSGHHAESARRARNGGRRHVAAMDRATSERPSAAKGTR